MRKPPSVDYRRPAPREALVPLDVDADGGPCTIHPCRGCQRKAWRQQRPVRALCPRLCAARLCRVRACALLISQPTPHRRECDDMLAVVLDRAELIEEWLREQQPLQASLGFNAAS